MDELIIRRWMVHRWSWSGVAVWSGGEFVGLLGNSDTARGI